MKIYFLYYYIMAFDITTVIYIILILLVLTMIYNFWLYSNENFVNHPRKSKIQLIIYHMAGCPHCTDIMKGSPSKYMSLKQVFKNNPNVSIIDFEVGKNKEASKYNSFPTIELVKNGDTKLYEGERTVDAMKNAIKEMLNN